jgi:hypothetical protein
LILDIIGIGAKLIDKLIPDKQAAADAKLKLLELQQNGALAELNAASNIIQAEAQSEHWMTATWRPVVMLTFTALVVAHFLGWTAPNITEIQIEGLLKIVQYGLTGYIVGRSTEKGIKEWKK